MFKRGIIIALLCGTAVMTASASTTESQTVHTQKQKAYGEALQIFKQPGSFPLIDALSVAKGDGHLKGFEPYIIGGEDAAIEEFPWQVSLIINGVRFCGGSLIKPDWVVTAAHCVDKGTRSDQVQVLAGTDDLQGGSGLEIQVINILIHNGWYPPSSEVPVTSDHDIALLQLADSVQLDTIPLLTPEDETIFLHIGEAEITGWGSTEEGGALSPKLQKAGVRIVDRNICKQSYGSQLPITENMVCADHNAGTVGPCHGDSGGPLMIRGPKNKRVLAGVTGGGGACAQAFSVYTSVAKHWAWIEQHAT